MQPIVNGLEGEYEGRLAFERIDAASEVGRRRLQHYSLRAHPSFVMVDPQGNALWSATGQISVDQLRSQIEAAVQ